MNEEVECCLPVSNKHFMQIAQSHHGDFETRRYSGYDRQEITAKHDASQSRTTHRLLRRFADVAAAGAVET